MGQKKSQKLHTLNMNGPLVTARIIGEQLGSKNPVIVAFGLQDNQRYRPLFTHGVSCFFLMIISVDFDHMFL